MGKRRKLMSFREGQVEKEVRRKKRVFQLTKSLKHRGNNTIPFPVDKIGAPLQFSKTVPSEREMNPSNQKHFRRAGRRRKAKSRVSKIVDDHAAPLRVAHHCFTILEQNRKASFLPTSSPSKEPFSSSFEAVGSCEIPSSEKVDSALDDKKITKIRHYRRSRKRGKGGHCDAQHMAHSLLQPQSYFSSNHSSAIRILERGNYSENADGIRLPAANKLVLSAEKEKYSLINATFDDSKNVCIPFEVNTDSSNCSDIGKHGKKINMARRQDMKCLRNDVHKNHRADTASLNNGKAERETPLLFHPYDDLYFQFSLQFCPHHRGKAGRRSHYLFTILVTSYLCTAAFHSLPGSALALGDDKNGSNFMRKLIDLLSTFPEQIPMSKPCRRRDLRRAEARMLPRLFPVDRG
ncbi:hypothetical protein KFK09_016952 [Dendrobium nobile]|uniref:Uncharacterized protein n=1 Tax=Dendrobium nobile TaxID=94219 RepID=A0A8T3B0W1_DENNO|nr:hypothetical protein KFK09_016952 [Dendrobium nobile]